MRRIFIICLLLAGVFAQAQDSVAHFNVGVSANSGLNYYGRVDSLHSSGGGPFVGLTLKNGLYVNAHAVFIHNALQSKYAATLVEGGYSFRNKKNSFAGTLSTTRFFYQDDISLVQSAVKQSVTASVTFLNKGVNVTLGGDVKFSDQADPGAQLGLDHIIKWTRVFKHGVIVLDPAAYAYAGTQRFTQSWLQQKKFLFLPAGDEMLTKNSRRFNILSYEASMPMVFAYNKFQFILSPAYVLPQHLLTDTEAKNLFYVTAVVKFIL